MKKLVYLILTSSVVLLTGCDQSVNEFVKGVKPVVDELSPVLQTDSSKPVKISPGHANSAGTNYRAVMTVTPTQRSVSGSTYRADLSLSQQRQ